MSQYTHLVYAVMYLYEIRDLCHIPSDIAVINPLET